MVPKSKETRDSTVLQWELIGSCNRLIADICGRRKCRFKYLDTTYLGLIMSWNEGKTETKDGDGGCLIQLY